MDEHTPRQREGHGEVLQVVDLDDVGAGHVTKHEAVRRHKLPARGLDRIAGEE